MWYGLTRDEAALRCKSLGVECRFLETRDPKASGTDVSGTAESKGIEKVIRGREEDGRMIFLLGRFAEGKSSGADR